MLTCPILNEAELRYNEGRNELALVGNNSHLIDELIYQEQRFNLLRSDIFTIRCLEQILDTLGEIKLTILQIARITGMEESILVECLRIGGITMIISPLP